MAIDKLEARTLVSNAIRAGTLVRQPCGQCGAPYVHAHHDDYARPLDIRWLCPSCHMAHHAAIRQQNRRSYLVGLNLANDLSKHKPLEQ